MKVFSFRVETWKPAGSITNKLLRFYCVINDEFFFNNLSDIKVPMNWKIIAAYLKGFSKHTRIAFSFLEYLFRFRDIDVFVLRNFISCAAKTVKYWIKNISRNVGAVFFKLGTRNVHHKRNKMTPVKYDEGIWIESLRVLCFLCT